MAKVRRERPGDIQDIRDINLRAFEREGEAVLVDRLRGEVYPFISLVAEEDGGVTGHILFTPVSAGGTGLRALGLGPMAVLPEKQGGGIGTALIREGLELCREEGFQAVFVVGHADYYTRFGFEHASARGLYWKSQEYAPYFFVLELEKGALEGVMGEVIFHPAFDEV